MAGISELRTFIHLFPHPFQGQHSFLESVGCYQWTWVWAFGFNFLFLLSFLLPSPPVSPLLGYSLVPLPFTEPYDVQD